MRYMLDTNILVYVLNARPGHESILERFDREEPQNMVVSSITLAELRYGIEKSQRREANRRALHRVLRLRTPVADFSVRRAACPGSIAPPTGLPAAIGTAPPPAGCAAYRIVIPGPHRVVEVRVGVTAAVVIALSFGKAVAAREVKDPHGIHTRFDELNVDEVVIYAGSAAKSLEICLDQPPDQREEDAMWAHEPFLAHGLQLPLRALDPTLASAPDELALATSRLLPGEDHCGRRKRAPSTSTSTLRPTRCRQIERTFLGRQH